MLDVRTIEVSDQLSIRDALQGLNDSGQGVLLIVDENRRLLRTVTDGDLRRLLLNGHDLHSRLQQLPVLSPKSILADSSPADALRLMDQHEIDRLPAVDEAGRVVRLWTRRDVSPVLLSTPHLGDQEQEFVAEAFRTNWIAPLGPNVDAFEKEISEFAGVSHGAAMSSGTAALHVALRLLNVGPGDVVFCSSFTFVASANPIVYQNATPVFIDSEPDTWNMSPAALRRAMEDASIEKRLPKAVIVVNLYGQSADMDPIMAICDEFGVPLVEDAAESLGATYKGKMSGSFGKVGIFSFNGNKIITTSGGGMLVSNDAEMIRRARFLSTQARDAAPHYHHTEVGYNYRMSNVLAGIGRGQLRVLPERIAARRRIFDTYRAQVSTDLLEWMPEAGFGESNRWLTTLTVGKKPGLPAASELIARLGQQNIEARALWKPMHAQPLFAGNRYYSHARDFSVCDDLFERGVCLPSGSNMNEFQQKRVIEALENALKPAAVFA